MPNEYSLSDLVKLTGVTERTVRFYISQGLLPPPSQKGPNARYAEEHLDRLRLIKKMQLAHLPLAEIRNRLDALPEDELAALAQSAPTYEQPTDSALDYIDGVLGRRATPLAAAAPVTPAAPAAVRAPALSLPVPPTPVPPA